MDLITTPAARTFYGDLKTTLALYEQKSVSPHRLSSSPAPPPAVAVPDEPVTVLPAIPRVSSYPLLEACASFVTCQDQPLDDVQKIEEPEKVQDEPIPSPSATTAAKTEGAPPPPLGDERDIFLGDIKSILGKVAESATDFDLDLSLCSTSLSLLYYCAIVKCLSVHAETPVRLLSFEPSTKSRASSSSQVDESPNFEKTATERPTSAAFKHLKESAQALKASITSLNHPDKAEPKEIPSHLPQQAGSTAWLNTWKKTKTISSTWAGTIRRTLKTAGHREAQSEECAKISVSTFLSDLVSYVKKSSCLESLCLNDVSWLSDDDLANFFYQASSSPIEKSLLSFSADRTSAGPRMIQAMIDVSSQKANERLGHLEQLSFAGCTALQTSSDKLISLVKSLPKLQRLKLEPEQPTVAAQFLLQQMSRDIVAELIQTVEDKLSTQKEEAKKTRNFKNRMDTFRKGIQDRNVHEPILINGEIRLPTSEEATSPNTASQRVPLYKVTFVCFLSYIHSC